MIVGKWNEKMLTEMNTIGVANRLMKSFAVVVDVDAHTALK